MYAVWFCALGRGCGPICEPYNVYKGGYMEVGTVQCLSPFPLDNIPPEEDGNVHRSVGTTATEMWLNPESHGTRKDVVCELILIRSIFMS